MNQYLQHDAIIDWHHPTILKVAQGLAASNRQPTEIARNCFEFVRDEIEHSGDYRRNQTTCTASDVLTYKTGWCYAKSHLLAALLRANGIPAGLCYQRLTVEGDHAPFCLHGLNALWLEEFGWYRVDARGNNDQVSAEFTPQLEQLAFPIRHPGEADLQGIWPLPLPVVVQTLTQNHSYQAVKNNLPDIELF